MSPAQKRASSILTEICLETEAGDGLYGWLSAQCVVTFASLV